MSRPKLDEAVTKFQEFCKTRSCQDIGSYLVSFILEADHGSWDSCPSRDKAAIARFLNDLTSWSEHSRNPADPVIYTGSHYCTTDR